MKKIIFTILICFALSISSFAQWNQNGCSTNGSDNSAGGQNNNAVADYSMVHGLNSQTDGTASMAFGERAFTGRDGHWSFAGGHTSTANSRYSMAMGIEASTSNPEGIAMFSFGQNVSTTGSNAYSLGKFLLSSAYNSYTIGSGVSSGTPLTNNIASSFMIGFMHNQPTFFVQGVSNAIGKVGIGTTSPSYLLDVNGQTATTELFVRGTTSYPATTGYVLTCLNPATGEAVWAQGGGTGVDYDWQIIGNNLLTGHGGSYPTGNVGIGSVTTTSRLNVESTTNLDNVGTFTNYNADKTAVVANGGRTGVYAYAGVVNTTTITDRHGVFAFANIASNRAIGVQSSADNGLYNYGVYGLGGTLNSTGTNYGVYGFAQSNSAISYGVYGWCPNWAGYFTGNVYTTGTYQSSDAKLKKDVKSINNALSIVDQLAPSSYYYKTDEYEGMNLNKGLNYGFIAQELETVLPDLVREVKQAAVLDADGKEMYEAVEFKAINYDALIPILTKAIQEQQEQISDLESRLEAMEVPALAVSKKQENTIMNAELKQNAPNPFTHSTIISYSLPASYNTAHIYIYNMSGTQLMEFDLAANDGSTVEINGNTMKAGMYLYALVIDGEIIDTKQMILTK